MVHQGNGACGGGGIWIVHAGGHHGVGGFEVPGCGLGEGPPVVRAEAEVVVHQPVAATEVVLDPGQVDGGGDRVDPHVVGECLPPGAAVQQAQSDQVRLHARREREQQVPVAAGAGRAQQDGEEGRRQQVGGARAGERHRAAVHRAGALVQPPGPGGRPALGVDPYGEYREPRHLDAGQVGGAVAYAGGEAAEHGDGQPARPALRGHLPLLPDVPTELMRAQLAVPGLVPTSP